MATTQCGQYHVNYRGVGDWNSGQWPALEAILVWQEAHL